MKTYIKLKGVEDRLTVKESFATVEKRLYSASQFIKVVIFGSGAIILNKDEISAVRGEEKVKVNIKKEGVK